MLQSLWQKQIEAYLILVDECFTSAKIIMTMILKNIQMIIIGSNSHLMVSFINNDICVPKTIINIVKEIR